MTLTVDAPSSLAATVRRVEEIDREALARELEAAGLELPAQAHVTLVPEDDPRARQTPRWFVGRAFGERDIVIFPARIASYPFDSLESVLRHEIVHLALSARAGGQPLPRWFHEGVAVSVEGGWDVTEQLRLLVASLTEPAISDVARLFESEAHPDTQLAYLLAAVLTDDLRRRHGAALPGAIAFRVAHGIAFGQAFEIETGETPDAAAMRAWAGYRRWATWLPALTGASALWTAILSLAFLAFVVRLRRRARQRRAWDEDREG
jgi:hypothetical protein